jgi:hypothetical protein
MTIAAFGRHGSMYRAFAGLFIAVAAVGFVMVAASGRALAQEPGGVDPQRNCQTLRTCNFNKGGSFRGCISTYSCKACRFVPGKCSVGASMGTCYRQVCDWTGS